IAASGIIAEINTKAWADHKRIFPAPRYLRRLKDAGVPIIVNSDAHLPALINASRQYGFELLNSN
ncbi:MAG: histidinol-phosphatase, partial [Muribaculaceae bacterium]|nr:histidinol-phosphatase [Muribaculaceae bacterium]